MVGYQQLVMIVVRCGWCDRDSDSDSQFLV